MADSSHPQGYQCEFVDSVLDNFFCKKCSLVARRLTFTSCCGESYCHACIADIQQQDEPCPECGQQNFTTIKPLKYQRQMDSLKVYCSMQGRGCSWSGTLSQLDAHLDPEQNHCQHVDTKCPLHCHKTIPRNQVEQHVVKECCKRDHVCQYCGFRATYNVVVNTHLPQCIYLPLQCPNICGVTCERDDMGDHMRICRLEEVACEFSAVGCDARFRREDQEEHARQNHQKHLTKMADASVKMNQLFHQKLQEHADRREQKYHEQEMKFKIKFEEQEKRFQEKERKFQEMQEELGQQEQKFEKKFEKQEETFRKVLQEKDKKLVALQKRTYQNEIAVREVTNFISLKRTFGMENFSEEKKRNKPRDWKSPAMYTHVCGYKFCIGIDANGYGDACGKAMMVDLWFMQGEYDNQLKWPAQASFTLELLNQQGGENIIHSRTRVEWRKPKTSYEYKWYFGCFRYGMYLAFLQHSELKDFLANDTLNFHLSDIVIH